MNGAEFWRSISPDAWLTSMGTLIGAFLGAALAGGFAVYVVKKQLQYDSNNKRQEDLAKILKTSVVFLAKHGTYNDFLKKNLERLQASSEKVSQEDIVEFTIFKKDAELDSKELISLPIENMSFESYKKYVVVTKLIQITNVNLFNIVETLKINNEKSGIGKYISTLEKTLVRLEKEYEDLKEVQLEEMAEYKKLKTLTKKKNK
ncbi:hypothetical protein [Planococcus citreus]|uniref:Uncharacterized protein n=1 Tax=Planococcus citreus TaxID=1373 RepID=A0A497YNK3_9BACL|nr:hypothetical protein [Planococcus citreus]RLJ89913.1 hypothetical protein DFR62_0053 [Planococcus citreus]